jgi:hypothetical protein
MSEEYTDIEQALAAALPVELRHFAPDLAALFGGLPPAALAARVAARPELRTALLALVGQTLDVAGRPLHIAGNVGTLQQVTITGGYVERIVGTTITMQLPQPSTDPATASKHRRKWVAGSLPRSPRSAQRRNRVSMHHVPSEDGLQNLEARLPKEPREHADAVMAQRRRLVLYRETLAHYLDQLAITGSANARPEVTAGIREARAGITRAKAALAALGEAAEDIPDDTL